MKKEMSSFDVGAVVREMAALEEGHLDKVYQTGTDLLIRINLKGAGKEDLFFRGGKWLYLAPDRPETDSTPGPFAAFLRKHLSNARIGVARQSGSDRMVVLPGFKSDGEFNLVFEMFGGGNVLLVKDGEIVNCLVQKNYRDRVTRPGQPYVAPKQRFDPFTASEEEFAAEFRTSDADTVRSLATVNNLGGQYAEEVCARAGAEKGTPAPEVTDEQLGKLYTALRSLVSDMHDNPAALIYRKNGEIVDIAPTELAVHADAEKEQVASISDAVGALMAETASKKKEERTDPEIEKLKKRIVKQTETVELYRAEADAFKTQADTLYTEYQKVSELLAVLSEQSAKLTWEKLEAGARKIPWVTAIDPSKNSVTAKVGDLEVRMDYTKSLDANASDIYAAGKTALQKAANAQTALDESKTELQKREAEFGRRKELEASRATPTKRFWFEAYKWFITSEGKLVLGGRDVRSNDAVVKKHMKEHDLYAHADIHGAPSIVVKDGLSASEGEMREACWFALAQSKAWTAGSPEGGAFWTYPDQVSKTPDAGQFVPRGAFIIRGKRNWEYHIPLEMGIGEIAYEGNRKIMCAPVPVIEKACTRYVVIKPSKEKNPRLNGELAKMFSVPEEEISTIVPPGPATVIRTVVPETQEENPEV